MSGIKLYQTSRAVKTIVAAIGEPDEIDDRRRYWCWGDSRLTLSQYDVSRCTVLRCRRREDGEWVLMSRAEGTRDYTIPALIRRHLTFARGYLQPTIYIASRLDLTLYLFVRRLVTDLPAELQKLAYGFMRGQIPGGIMLDAIKHDTDILK